MSTCLQVQNHRVMENYNSVSGVGCDVHNAIPFYHVRTSPSPIAAISDIPIK